MRYGLDEAKKGIRETKRAFGLANHLTLFRLACVPVFILFFSLKEYGVSLIVFSLAAFTDLIDGTVARLMKQNSDLGAVLDPIADKGLMLTTFICLAIAGIIPFPELFIGIILVRDIVVTAGFIYLKMKNIKFKYHAIFSSKAATLFEIVAGVIGLFALTYPDATLMNYPLSEISVIVLSIAAVLILIATLLYLRMGLQIVRDGSTR